MRSALDIWNTSPPVVLVSLSFLKTLKCSGKISPFLTEGSNHDSSWSLLLFIGFLVIVLLLLVVVLFEL